MDKEFVYSRIMEIISEYRNVHDWMEINRKMYRLTRSEYWLVVKAAIDQMKSCHYEDYRNLTVEEIVKYHESPFYYISSDQFEFYLSKFEEYLDFLLKGPAKSNIETNLQSEISKGNSKPKYTINQIALRYVYEREAITPDNSTEIAIKYGHTSGDKLLLQYSFFKSDANRKGRPNPFTRIKTKNKIGLLESVIKMVTESNRQRIIDEIVILKGIYETEF